jgi:hypothetical protein
MGISHFIKRDKENSCNAASSVALEFVREIQLKTAGFGDPLIIGDAGSAGHGREQVSHRIFWKASSLFFSSMSTTHPKRQLAAIVMLTVPKLWDVLVAARIVKTTRTRCDIGIETRELHLTCWQTLCHNSSQANSRCRFAIQILWPAKLALLEMLAFERK